MVSTGLGRNNNLIERGTSAKGVPLFYYLKQTSEHQIEYKLDIISIRIEDENK